MTDETCRNPGCPQHGTLGVTPTPRGHTMTEHLTPHPGWTPTTARLVAAVGWLCGVVGGLIALAGVVDASVVVAVTGGGLAGLGYTMIRWGRMVRRYLESS